MRTGSILFLLCLTFATMTVAQAHKPNTPDTPANPGDISGMYTFLEDGEFLQVTVEEQQKVTGFISRYGDLPSDKGAFLDHFIKKGTLAGNQLNFITEVLHGITYQFQGTVGRGPGKSPAEDAYYVLKGTLTQTTTDAQHQPKTRSREVEFKSFPQDALPPHTNRD